MISDQVGSYRDPLAANSSENTTNVSRDVVWTLDIRTDQGALVDMVSSHGE